MAGDGSLPAAVYLDHASTTPLRPEAVAVMDRASRDGFANPSSQHAAGRRARQMLEEARERILTCLGGRPSGKTRDRLVFTSGATESNRFAVLGMATGPAGAIATSARDHASLRSAALAAAHERGWSLTELPLTAGGTVDPEAIASWIDHTQTAPSRILGTTPVCGQTGSREPTTTIVELFHDRGPCLVHADATQAVACDAVSFADLGIATMTIAPHKFGGPRGIGALVVRGDVPLAPLHPGTQETGLRGGTEPVMLAAGFAAAIEAAVNERSHLSARLAALRDRFETTVMRLAEARGIPAVAIGAAGPRSPHITTISFPGRDRQALVMAADLAGLCCATGSACASGSSEPSPALVAMGLPGDVVRGAVRFSFGRTTTDDEIDRAINIVARILE